MSENLPHWKNITALKVHVTIGTKTFHNDPGNFEVFFSHQNELYVCQRMGSETI